MPRGWRRCAGCAGVGKADRSVRRVHGTVGGWRNISADAGGCGSTRLAARVATRNVVERAPRPTMRPRGSTVPTLRSHRGRPFRAATPRGTCAGFRTSRRGVGAGVAPSRCRSRRVPGRVRCRHRRRPTSRPALLSGWEPRRPLRGTGNVTTATIPVTASVVCAGWSGPGRHRSASRPRCARGTLPGRPRRTCARRSAT